jgi:hypothetical protein
MSHLYVQWTALVPSMYELIFSLSFWTLYSLLSEISF